MPEILDLKYEKYTLKNGLEVILHKNDTLPLVAVNLWYKVGSANETKGKTGFAHLFEHMMFQGSKNIPKEMHFRYIQEAGGTLNGSTSLDRTNYYETVPSNSLELALWLESDRMGFMLPALTEEKLQNQKDVVMNERRQRYDNQPYGRAWETIFSNLYPKDFPYHWPTIGWMEDIEKFRLEDVKEFFGKFYTPNNASLVIAGNFKHEEAEKLIENYFSDIPAGPEISSGIYFKPILENNIETVLEDNVQLPRIYLTWLSEKLYGQDDAALDILSDILSGSKGSRLHKLLVHNQQIAQDVSCYQYSSVLSGNFIIASTAKPGVSLSELKKLIFSEIENVIKNGVTERELERARNNFESSFIYSLQNIDMIADQLNNYNCNLGKPNMFNHDLGRYSQLSPENIKEAALKYLSNPYVQLSVLPKRKK
ncbi:MAG: insulinase family protein [Ignavibacteria bacterium]|nr:insulinase family protein [Ignavibacteria bacterium]